MSEKEKSHKISITIEASKLCSLMSSDNSIFRFSVQDRFFEKVLDAFLTEIIIFIQGTSFSFPIYKHHRDTPISCIFFFSNESDTQNASKYK